MIAYRSLSTWREEGSLGAWLSRIAVRVALRMASRRRSVTWIDPLTPSAAVEASDAAGRGGAARPGSADDPASHALRVERDAGIRAAVAALDEPYREVVALRFFADLTLGEIAAQTERPLGTIKTQLHRGLARLRQQLEPEAAR